MFLLYLPKPTIIIQRFDAPSWNTSVWEQRTNLKLRKCFFIFRSLYWGICERAVFNWKVSWCWGRVQSQNGVTQKTEKTHHTCCFPQNQEIPFNPFTARVFDGVLYGDFNFLVCGQNPMMWPFKWKLSAFTFTWCYFFLKILENEIWKFGRNLPLATFGSERVNCNGYCGWLLIDSWT